MTIAKKPDEHIFASAAKRGEVDNFPDISRGWGFTFEQTQGIPTMEHFNALFKRIDEHFNYLMQRGLPEWSATQHYPAGAYVQHNGKSYRAVRENQAQAPDATDSTAWARWATDRNNLVPLPISANSRNEITDTGHSHAIDIASLIKAGIVRLSNELNSDDETKAPTLKAIKTLKGFIDSNTRSLGNYIPNSKKSSAVNSNSADTVATSSAVKTAYDKGVEAKTAADNANNNANGRVSKAGDTMNGLLIINHASALVQGKRNNVSKWFVGLPNENDEKVMFHHYGQDISLTLDNNRATFNKPAYVNQAKLLIDTDISHKTDGTDKTKVASEFALGEVAKKSLPLGSVIGFPKEIAHPAGFLLADGSTFNQGAFPDLYRVLGNSNRLPNLQRSDVGVTAWFAVDNIPAGWIPFDEIASRVGSRADQYPELYRHLSAKYGGMTNVPKVGDRFIRNAGNGLRVGAVQDDEIKRHVHNHIENNTSYQGAYNDKTFDWSSRSSQDREFLDITTAIRDDNNDNWWITPNINSQFATGGAETRPKSLVLKLCIKAQNSFEDVKFWVKAFGAVDNEGLLVASQLAQGLQGKADRNHTHHAADILDFSQAVKTLMPNTFNQNGWQKLPNGLILQWGVLSAAYETRKDYNFNIAFPNQCFAVMASISIDIDIIPMNTRQAMYSGRYLDGMSATALFAKAISNTQMRIYQDNNVNSNAEGSVTWFAIGY